MDKLKMKERQKIVEEVLIKNPQAREDDFVLISEVLEITNPETKYMTIGDVLENGKVLGIPPFSSIVRARRKVFKENPELCPKQIKEIRAKEEKEYRDVFKKE